MDLKIVSDLIKKGKKGEQWVKATLPVLVEISREIKELERRMEEEAGPLKIMLEGIKAQYKPRLEELEKANQELREWVLKEHEGTDSVSQEGIGTIVFPQRLGFEVVDLQKVDRKYLMIDKVAVNKDIKAGVSNIKGIKIEMKRGVEVRPSGDSNS